MAKQYTVGQAWKIPGLYSVNGDLVDYVYHQFSIPAFSIEVSTEMAMMIIMMNDYNDDYNDDVNDDDHDDK